MHRFFRFTAVAAVIVWGSVAQAQDINLTCTSGVLNRLEIKTEADHYRVTLQLEQGAFRKLIHNSRYNLELALEATNFQAGIVSMNLPKANCVCSFDKGTFPILQCGDEDHPITPTEMEFSTLQNRSQVETRSKNTYFNIRFLDIYDRQESADSTALDATFGIYAGLGRYFAMTQAFQTASCQVGGVK